jgi:hypothetical protein
MNLKSQQGDLCDPMSAYLPSSYDKGKTFSRTERLQLWSNIAKYLLNVTKWEYRNVPLKIDFLDLPSDVLQNEIQWTH